MNYYFLILLIGGLLIMLGGIVRGYRDGIVKQADLLLSMTGAFLCFRLVTRLGGDYAKKNISGAAVSIALLLFVIIVFVLCRMLLAGLHLISRLPVIRIVDNLLGAAGGGIIAFFFLYIAQYLLECYVGL